MKENDIVFLQRIQSSLVADKRFKPDNLSHILKSEIINILENYLLLDREDVSLKVGINDCGFIEVNLKAIAKRSKIISVLPDENSYI